MFHVEQSYSHKWGRVGSLYPSAYVAVGLLSSLNSKLLTEL